MTTATPDLWTLVLGRPEVDPDDLAAAIAAEAVKPQPDFRTCLLIRDGLEALRGYWGAELLRAWLEASSARAAIEDLLTEDLGAPGFPTLADRIMQKTSPELIRQFLRDLGSRLPGQTCLVLGGSSALILQGYLNRQTEDIDVVDEVPGSIRSQHQLLDELRRDYGLLLAHFQSHYLPTGWERRIHSLGDFGSLQIHLVDVYDIFLGKLFSKRRKDLGDLRVVLPQLDRAILVRRLQETTTSWRAETALREQAATNWYILFGEELPA